MSPIYEYECPECGHRFEGIYRFDDREDANCPECGHEDVVILVSASVAHGLSTPGRGGYDRLNDDGFQKEWDSIWADDPTATQRSSLDEE